MKRIGCAVLGLAACVVLLAAATGDPPAPIRPLLYLGNDTHVIHLLTGEDNYSGFGVASTVGQVEQEGTGFLDLNTMSFALEGTVTTPSGDQIFWTGSGVMGPDMVLVFDGGTGRFENTHGELNSWEFTNMQQVVEWPFLTITFESKATGWTSY